MRLLFIIEGIIENNKGISVTLSIVALLFIKKKKKQIHFCICRKVLNEEKNYTSDEL